MLQHLPILLLAVCAATFGEEVPCMTSEENCTQGIGYSALSILNDSYYCCVLGYTMTWDNDQCLCNKTSQVTECEAGPVACGNATSLDAEVHSEDRDSIQCCQEGYTKHNLAGYLKGDPVSTCMCLNDSAVFVAVVSADEYSVNYTNYVGDPSSIDTGFIQRLLDWRDRVFELVNDRLNALNTYLDDVFSSWWSWE